MLLLLDESGTDHRATPYEITGGVTIPEQQFWTFSQDADWLQQDCFGGRLRDLAPGKEFKGKDLLARDKFRYAAQGPELPRRQRRVLARAFLERGTRHESPRRDEFTAYGQACLCYVDELLELGLVHGIKVFASIVHPDAPLTSSVSALRRDLSFLFERYYYLEDLGPESRGLVVFDELEKSLCRGIIDRMEAYFVLTANGQERSRLIIPEPFFVHSDLTTGVQVADIAIYILNWAYRYGEMDRPTRAEFSAYVAKLQQMVYKTRRPRDEHAGWEIWSIKYLDDLRARHER